MLSKLKVAWVTKSIKSHHCDDGVNGLSSVQAKIQYLLTGAIIGDGDRKRGVHAKPSKKTNVLFLAKIAPPSTS